MRPLCLILMLPALLMAPALSRAAQATTAPETCGRDLALTETRLQQTLARLAATRSAPMPQRCAVFRDHISVMSAAARVYDRCNTGRTRQENVGQMQESVADFREIVARNCR